MRESGGRETARQIGVISDTHGLLRPEAVAALSGSDLIIHAGDVGKPEVLQALRAVAPVAAVRGNVDAGDWAEELPLTEVVEVAGISIYVLHNLEDLDFDPTAAGFRAVISGHTHTPSVRERGGSLFINPGSAGPRRFDLLVSVARLTVREGKLTARLVELAC